MRIKQQLELSGEPGEDSATKEGVPAIHPESAARVLEETSVKFATSINSVQRETAFLQLVGALGWDILWCHFEKQK